MTLQEHIVGALEAAPKHYDPFPWFYVDNVFPPDFYTHFLNVLDTKTDYQIRHFANRAFADALGIPELNFMYDKPFFFSMLHLFEDALKAEFGGGSHTFSGDIRLIRDSQNYKIGPHTDAPWKVLSLLFYLPRDDSLRDYGTAFYEPLDPAFRCPGGPHHPFDQFRETWRAPFVPNTCLGFWKTDHSFHGVPPIPEPVRRDVLLYNIFRKIPPRGET